MKKIIVALVTLSIVLGLYYRLNDTLGICAGALWGFLNFYLIRQLLFVLLMPQEKNIAKIAIVGLLKFPLLYAVGYSLLLVDLFTPWDLMIGFTLILLGYTSNWFWEQLREKEVKT